MITENDTTFPARFVRDARDASVSVTVTTKVTLDVASDLGAQPPVSRAQLPLYEEPCDEAPLSDLRAMRSPQLAEITVVGRVKRTAPFSRVRVHLRVGEHERSLVVFGRRTWTRRGGGLTPSAPDPVRAVEMSWSMAYGGVVAFPAGFLPGTRTPAPTMRLAATNPHGQGFYFREEDAEGGPLPQLESDESPIQHWNDRPEPVCWAAMPLDHGLRMAHLAVAREGGRDRLVNGDGSELPLHERIRATAPPPLQFPHLAEGTPIVLLGHDDGSGLAFRIPRAPIRLRADVGRRRPERFEPRLVGLQLRADEARACLLYEACVDIPLARGESRAVTLEVAS